METTGGLINDLIIFGLFIYLSLLVSGKVKLQQPLQEKFESLMQRNGLLIKVLVYGGTLIFGALIIINLFPI